MICRLVPALGIVLLAAAVGFGDEKEGVPALVKQLKDKDASVRLRAAKALLLLGPEAKEAIPALEEAAYDKDEDVAAMAAKALKAVGREEKKTNPVSERVAELKGKKTADRIRAAKALGKLGTEAAPALRDLCDAALDKSPELAEACLDAIERIDPKLHKGLVPFFVTGKDSDQPKILDDQTAGMRELQALGRDAKPAIPVLLAHVQKMKTVAANYKGIKEGPLKPVLNALEEDVVTLSKIADGDTQAVKALIAIAGLTGERYASIRKAVVVALGSIGEAHDDVRKLIVPALVAAMKEEETRVVAAHGLGGFGGAAKEALPTLKKYKLDTNRAVRDAVTEAIKQIEKD